MTIMAGACGNTLQAPISGDVITLSGSTGSPNTSTDFAISPSNAYVWWYFNSDGTVDRLKLQGADSLEIFGPSQWCLGTPTVDYWIRFTANSGNAANLGDSSGSWLALTSNRSQGWQEIQNDFAVYTGSSKVEIATDAAGVTIVATGYYGGTASIEL